MQRQAAISKAKWVEEIMQNYEFKYMENRSKVIEQLCPFFPPYCEMAHGQVQEQQFVDKNVAINTDYRKSCTDFPTCAKIAQQQLHFLWCPNISSLPHLQRNGKSARLGTVYTISLILKTFYFF